MRKEKNKKIKNTLEIIVFVGLFHPETENYLINDAATNTITCAVCHKCA